MNATLTPIPTREGDKGNPRQQRCAGVEEQITEQTIERACPFLPACPPRHLS
jgi:hypothetical protein